jgi:hypothetical protein
VVAEEIAIELNRPDVRVLVLNETSPHLSCDMIRRGDPIYIGSDDLVGEFEARVQTDFLRSVRERILPEEG